MHQRTLGTVLPVSGQAKHQGFLEALSEVIAALEVRNHVAKLFVALGVHSRLQAVAVARAAGILDA
jgi:DNA-binding NarL/FixJ family response regulator